MSFSRYKEYKDSEVEWLGEVPRHWEVKQLKWVVMFQRGHDLPADLREDGSVPLVSSSGISATHSRAAAKAPGIVTGRYGTIGNFHLIREDYWPLNTTLYSIDMHGNNPRYVQLLLTHLAPLFLMNAVKSAVPGVDRNDIHPISLCVAPHSEQVAISAFLDHEISKIDMLVAEQEKLIALLKEKRQAVISHAVTKGLDPTAPMKNSGIQWLGEIPEHWNIGRVKGLASIITKGTTPTTIGAQFVSSGIRFLKAENISDGAVCIEPEFFIDEETHQTLCRSALFDRDVLVVIAGATTGKSAVLRANALPANTNQAVAFIRCKNASVAEHLNYWLSTTTIQQAIKLNAVQSAQPNLSMEDLGNLQIVLPSVEEIQAIISFLESELKKVDAMVAEAQRAIKLLKERRSALISAAVTGKIDVRGLVGTTPASEALEPV